LRIVSLELHRNLDRITLHHRDILAPLDRHICGHFQQNRTRPLFHRDQFLTGPVHSGEASRRKRTGRSQAGGVAMVTVGSTDIPGEIERNASAGPSRAIFTGMRCTTLTKLPVAFSGGSKAKFDPVPR
jgi:hypothetical protein